MKPRHINTTMELWQKRKTKDNHTSAVYASIVFLFFVLFHYSVIGWSLYVLHLYLISVLSTDPFRLEKKFCRNFSPSLCCRLRITIKWTKEQTDNQPFATHLNSQTTQLKVSPRHFYLHHSHMPVKEALCISCTILHISFCNVSCRYM